MGLPQLYKFDCFEHVEISQVELLKGTRSGYISGSSVLYLVGNL